jgi:hypothetical protein
MLDEFSIAERCMTSSSRPKLHGDPEIRGELEMEKASARYR